MPGTLVGYARTSTVDQEAGFEAQIEELKAHGCEHIYAEQVSSVSAKRPELAAALKYVRKGDTFVVTKPDRLARSTLNLLTIIEDLTKRGVGVRILSMNIDTSTATGRAMLTILGAIAEMERSLMLERQRVGIAKAKADGKYKGRPPTARRKLKQIKQLDADGVGVAEIVKRTGVSRASVYRLLEGG